MKIDKKIRELPWPAQFDGIERQHFRVTLNWPVVNGEKILMATFCWNKGRGGKDFRVVCSKKQMAMAILYKGNNRGKRRSLDDVLYRGNTNARHCYPEISREDEKSLAKWLGKDPNSTTNHMMEEFDDWTCSAIRAEKLREMESRGDLWDEDVDLCPEDLPEGMVEYIRREVLPRDHTLIYRKGNVRGICYCCGQWVRAYQQRFRQNEMIRCPNCGEPVTCYLNTSDRFKVDYVQNIASIQKGSDGKTIFIRQWHICRDETAKWENIAGNLQEVCRYAIRGDRAAKWQKEAKEQWIMNTTRYYMEKWTRMKNISEVYDGTYVFYLPPQWRETVSGTSLQYCEMQQYEDYTARERNMIRFILDWARYPAVELFWKAGYRNLVNQKVLGLPKDQMPTVKWNRESIRDAIKIPLHLLKLQPPENWKMKDLQRVAACWDLVASGTIQPKELKDLFFHDVDLDYIGNALGHASVYKILKYIDGLVEQAHQKEPRYSSSDLHINRVTQTYRDYLQECVQLQLDLDSREILFPRDLDAAHARTASRVKFQQSKISKRNFAEVVKEAAWMAWEHDGFLIRLPKDGQEVAYEGQYLHHCVAGYVDRMAEGKTLILLIRKTEAPDTPFYTLEWLNGQVQQCRTTRNGSYSNDSDVYAFVNKWKKYLTKAKKNNSNGRKVA